MNKSKKKNLYLVVSIGMFIYAIGFLFYALNHPELSFPWSNNITYTIYLLYIILMIMCFVKSRRIK